MAQRRADSTGEETLVSLPDRISIGTSTLFAVTVEKSGGVVVVQSERMAVAAAPKPG
jgi:hypothetical protein